MGTQNQEMTRPLSHCESGTYLGTYSGFPTPPRIPFSLSQASDLQTKLCSGLSGFSNCQVSKDSIRNQLYHAPGTICVSCTTVPGENGDSVPATSEQVVGNTGELSKLQRQPRRQAVTVVSYIRDKGLHFQITCWCSGSAYFCEHCIGGCCTFFSCSLYSKVPSLRRVMLPKDMSWFPRKQILVLSLWQKEQNLIFF